MFVYRHVEKDEQEEALNLWCSIFNNSRELESRYFSSETSSLYQEGDTLGAWHNSQLVSTIHIRRFIVRSNDDHDKEYLCAGITNVVTAPEYRRRGISRHLLQMVVDKLENSDEFHLSMLGTNNPNHYVNFGWEQVLMPAEILVDWTKLNVSNANVEWHSVSYMINVHSELLFHIYSNNRRKYQMNRSPLSIFQQWVKGRWENSDAIMYLHEKHDEQGYVVIGQPDQEKECSILEWQTSSIDIEKKLLSLAAKEIQRRHKSIKFIRLFALPQYLTRNDFIEWIGPFHIDVNSNLMMRNIRLSVNVYDQMKTAYRNGDDVF